MPYNPETDNPVLNFLSSYFAARNMKANSQLNLSKLQLEQQKFQAEQANHAADMKQRASQFEQELSLRQQEHADSVKAQQALFKETQATRQDASQARFEDKGGIMMPTPQDKALDLGAPAPLQTNPASILMPRSPNQPVGPVPTMEAAGLSAVPAQAPAIPLQATLPAEAQRPDPTRFQRVPGPLGMPEGQEAYMPTLKGKVLETKEAQEEADKMTITPEMERAFGDLGLKAGDTVDKSLLPHMENAANRRLARTQAANEFQAKMLDSDEQKDKDRDLRALLAQIAANKPGKGEKTVSDEQATANHHSVMNATDPAEAYKSLSPLEKSRERMMLDDEGVGVPTALSAQSKTQETAARNSKGMIAQFERTLKDPVIANNIGPVMGRYEDLAQGKVGTTVHFTNDPVQNAAMNEKVQQFRSALTYMLFSEGKQLMPGRISSQLIGLLKETSPNPKQALPLLKGSLAAVKENANQFLTSAEKERFNGKTRPGFIENLYPERTKVQLNDNVKAKIPAGMSVTVGNHSIYHDPDDNNFYEVPQ